MKERFSQRAARDLPQYEKGRKTTMLWVASGVKTVDVERVLEFLDHCLHTGRGFHHHGKKYVFSGPASTVDLSRTNVLSLAAALVTSTAGQQKMTYADLHACSVVGRTDKPSSVTLRKFAEDLRNAWGAMLAQCGLDDNDDNLVLPPTHQPIALKRFERIFDPERVREALFKLRMPRLLPTFEDEAKPTIALDVLAPGEWKIVGHARDPEPLGKIALDYGKYLSRTAFRIRVGDGCLHVELMSKRNKLTFQEREFSSFDVPRGETFAFVDIQFRYWEGAETPDSSTPVYRNKRSASQRRPF